MGQQGPAGQEKRKEANAQAVKSRMGDQGRGWRLNSPRGCGGLGSERPM